MKQIPLYTSILIFLSILYLIFLNMHQQLVLTIYPNLQPIKVSLALLLILLSLYASLGSFLIANYSLQKLKDKLKKQTRNTEKASIESQESIDKIKSLEAKIATLEVALKESLNR